jgi:hypothetical protein
MDEQLWHAIDRWHGRIRARIWASSEQEAEAEKEVNAQPLDDCYLLPAMPTIDISQPRRPNKWTWSNCARWVRDHPRLVERLRQECIRQVQECGKASTKRAVEAVRWSEHTPINNYVSSFLASHFDESCPELRGRFDIRGRKKRR